jgi:hypothetical protein
VFGLLFRLLQNGAPAWNAVDIMHMSMERSAASSFLQTTAYAPQLASVFCPPVSALPTVRHVRIHSNDNVYVRILLQDNKVHVPCVCARCRDKERPKEDFVYAWRSTVYRLHTTEAARIGGATWPHGDMGTYVFETFDLWKP